VIDANDGVRFGARSRQSGIAAFESVDTSGQSKNARTHLINRERVRC